MRSPEQLRAEVSRLVDQIQRTKEVSLRQSLAARALELAQEAEAIASLPEDVEGLRLRIAQYRHMLARTESEPKQRVVAQLLRDAEDKLQQVSGQERTPRPRQVAAA
jgi:hypothetical protein